MKKKIIVVISIVIGLVLIAAAANALLSGSWNGALSSSQPGIADKKLTDSDNAQPDSGDTGSYAEKAPLMNVDIASVKGKAGDVAEIAVSFRSVPDKGINNCDFKLEYDVEMLESVEVIPADISTNFKSNFSSFVSQENGTISFLFMDNTLGKELILKDGTFATIKCRIKQDAKNGDTQIKLKTAGAFSNSDLKQIEADFSAGTLSVGQ